MASRNLESKNSAGKGGEILGHVSDGWKHLYDLYHVPILGQDPEVDDATSAGAKKCAQVPLRGVSFVGGFGRLYLSILSLRA